VGIRLTEGDDSLTTKTRGFPPEFVEPERHLCRRDQHEHVVGDVAVNLELDCMCATSSADA